MMKKNGFTLAEVLITLAIIGVVATLTLPALMTNTAEQQAKTGLKKGINTLTEAAQMNASIAGFDYSSVTSTGYGPGNDETQSLYGILANRTAVDFTKTGSDKGNHISGQGEAPSAMTDNYTVFFRDGSSFSYNPDNAVMSNASAKTIESDGLPHGLVGIYDTNGSKGPNILSFCSSAANPNVLGATSDALNGADLKTRCSKSQRVIKDQFGVRLRGFYAVPNGAAAHWVMSD